MALVISTWAANPITIDGVLAAPEWSGAGQMPIPAGFLKVKNDANFLYVALDLVGDLGADAGTGDYYWFTVDVDANAAITPNKDLNYAMLPGAPNVSRRQYFLGPGTWTGLLNEVTTNQTHIGFGPTSSSPIPHRAWELRINLSELGVDLSDPASLKVVRFGLRVASTTPGFTFDFPASFYTNFTNLHTIALALSPSLPPGLAGVVFGTVGFIPTTNISPDGFATTAPTYYFPVVEAAFGGSMNFIGNQVTMLALWAAGARKYKILHRAGTSGAFTNLRQSWANYHWNGSTYILEPFGADASDNYMLTNPSEEYSIKNLLLNWNSVGETPGIHQFQARFLRANGTTVVASTPQTVSLMVDNNQAQVQIINILHNGNPVPACAIETMTSNTDGLRFRITAHDAEEHLQAWSLTAHYGDNQSETIVSDSYSAHMNPDHLWSGVVNALVPATEWVPPISCAYQFRVSASPRVTNGYSYLGGVQFNRHVTIIKPDGAALAQPAFLSREFPLGMSGKKGPIVAGTVPAKLGSLTFRTAAAAAGGTKQKTAPKKPTAKKAAVKKPAGKKASTSRKK
jgi:hypothetical protein